MNQNTVISWVTTGFGIGAGAALDRGLIDANTATTIAGAAATLVPLLWGLFIHRDSKVVQTASALAEGQNPQIKPIETLPAASPAIAALAQDSNVPGVVPAPASQPVFTPSPSTKRYP